MTSYCDDRAKLLDQDGGKDKNKVIDDDDVVQVNRIKMIIAGSANTAVITSMDEVAVIGDNTFG